MDANRITTNAENPHHTTAPHQAELQPRRARPQADQAVADIMHGDHVGASDDAAATAGSEGASGLSVKAVNLARRYRHATLGVHGGSVMPWPDVMYRLQAWHGIRTTVAELRAALNQD